jgi:hypothetical protein
MKELNIKRIIITAIVFAISSSLAGFGVRYFTNKNNTFDKQLMRIASELNKTCPIMVDKDTQLDNSIALPDNIFQYNYTLVNHSRNELNIEQLQNTVTPRILNNIKTNEGLKYFRNNKVTMSYSYNDKNGVFLFVLKFKYKDYK